MTSTPVELADNVRERLASHDWGTLAPRVIGALEYSQELVDGLRRLPCLAVLPLGDDIDPDLAPEGTATLQHVRTTIGVVIVVASRNDRGASKQAAGDSALRRLQTALRARLVGWPPARRWDPLAVRRSRLLDLSGARASWQEDYTTFGWARQARQ
ncbi:MAG: hypothetical protein OXG72_21630 [Acidobacteria bacterium]|nr:hypothetical protein [Acidobacteriota bacterium]